MRRSLIALSCALSTAAGAQSDDARPPAAIAPKPAAAVQNPARDAVERAARELFLALLSGNARAVAEASAVPFHLEGERISDEDALVEEWLRHLRTRRVDLLVLYGIEVLTPEEMERTYGAPPARLGSLPWRGKDTYIAVANLSGRGAVTIFREVKRGEFRLVGYHD